MGNLVINHNLITPEKAHNLIKLCPFNAITYNNNKLEISSACKMCKMCVRKGEGTIDFVEEEIKAIDKSVWNGIAVYADCAGGELHRVTLELCGKARELAKVTNHPVYALLIGYNIEIEYK